MTEYTREELIAICERAFVPQDKWHDRDSCSSQIKLGSAYALLKAGCKFEVIHGDPHGCSTDADTIWLRFWTHNFRWFEYGDDDYPNGLEHDEVFYLPTAKRLNERNGSDWY